MAKELARIGDGLKHVDDPDVWNQDKATRGTA